MSPSRFWYEIIVASFALNANAHAEYGSVYLEDSRRATVELMAIVAMGVAPARTRVKEHTAS